MYSFFKDPLLVCLLAFSFLVRLLFLIVFPELDFPDARAYQTIGKEIFSGELITNDIYMPLYPILTYMTGGGVMQNIVDIIFSVTMVGVIYCLSTELFNNRISAIVAVVISSVYPHFLFYAIAGLTETFYTLLLLSSFFFFYKEKYLIAIFTLVLLILVRPSLDLLNPFLVIIFTFFVFRRGYIKSIKQALIYIFIYIVLMSPWWIHQHQKYGEFVRLNLGDGIVLYSGNNPLNITGGGVGRDAGPSDMNLSTFSDIVNPVERNHAMKQAAMNYIVANPGRFIELAGIKFVRFWRLWPHTEFYQQWYTIAASLLSYGVVLLLSIGFILRNSKEHFRRLLPIYALFGYLTLVHMVTIGSIRYRFPLEPFLIIFASQFLVSLLRNRSWFIIIQEKILKISSKQSP